MYCRTRHFITPEAHCFRRFFLSVFLLFFTFTNFFSKASSDSLTYIGSSTKQALPTSSIIHLSEGATIYGNLTLTNDKNESTKTAKKTKHSKKAKLVTKAVRLTKNLNPERVTKYTANTFRSKKDSVLGVSGSSGSQQAVSGNSQDKISEAEQIVILRINNLQLLCRNKISTYTNSAITNQEKHSYFCRPPPHKIPFYS